MEESIRLLQVDDQPDFLEASATFLERTDDRFTVETATSASDGLDLLAEQPFDCVVSDYEMPRIDGIEFLERVHEMYPDLPFILFTGRGSEEIASEAISAGVTDYLQKRRDTEQYELLANRITNAVTQYRAERNLEQIREFFNEAERLGNLGAWEFDSNGDCTWTDGTRDIHEVNDTFDPTVEDMIDFYHPEDRDRIEQAVTDALEHHREYDIEARLITAVGNERWVRTGGEPVENGETESRVRGYIQDITEQKAREKELEAINTRLQTVISNFPLILFVLNEDGVFTVSRGKALEKLDTEPREAEGMHYEEVYGDHDGILEDMERAFDGEEFRSTREVSGLIFEVTYQPVIEDGTVTAVIGVAIDITERKEREQALAALQDATRMMVDANQRDDVYDILVKTGKRILGFDIVTVDAARDDHLQQVASSFDPDENAHYESLGIDSDDTFATRAYRQGETIVTDDITEHDVTAAGSEYRSALTIPIGEFGVFQGGSTEPADFDETDRELGELLVEHARVKLARLDDQQRIRERTAELERQNERLEEVTSIVSHDLRNPLNVASLRLEQAQAEVDSDHLDVIANAHERMETLIEDLLLLAQGDDLINEIERIALSQFVERCWETVDTAEAKLHVETDRVIRADRQRLKQLFENLIRNAVEHGGETVSVTVGNTDEGFYIEDDGPGIPPDERETVFESGYSTARDGTGFGLSIVSEITQAHDWAVCVTEGTEGGARFEITGVTAHAT